jgi:outer membrane protein TolC
LDQSAQSFAARRLDAPELRRFLEASRGESLPDWPLKSWTFEDLCLAAVYWNPSLASARAQAEAAEAARQTAAGRPNPTIGLQGGFNFDASRAGITPWIPGTTLDLPIETAGKRSRRMERADHLARASRLTLVGTAWSIRSTLRTAVIESHGAQRRIELLKEELQAAESIQQGIQQRFQAGAATTLELANARVAALRIRGEIQDAERLAGEARHRVAEALGVPIQALTDLPWSSPSPAALPEDDSLTRLRRHTLHLRSDIQSALANYEASQSQLRIEIAKQYPDLHLGNGYQWDQGESKWTFGISLELPLLNRNQGPIAEAAAHRAEAAAQVLTVQARALAEFDRALGLARTLQHQQRAGQELARELSQQSERLAQRRKQGGADRLEVETARLEELTQRLLLLDVDQRLALAVGQWEDAIQQPVSIPANSSRPFPPSSPVPAVLP